MTPRMRRGAHALAVVSALLALLAAGTLYLLQTKWFRNKVRERVIASVEEVSGGRVEIGAFDYDWPTLTADFRDFVVHGTEPSSAQPLFRADRVRIGLKIISLLTRDIDVASVIVNQPKVSLLIAPDGSTNFPVPRFRRMTFAEGVHALVNLKVRHFEFNNGLFEADVQHIPLNVRGEDTSLLLSYVGAGRHYDVQFSSRQLNVNSERLRSFSGALVAQARLERDRFSIQRAVFTSGVSTFQMSGTLQHFAHPLFDYRLSADVDASDLAAVTKYEDIGHGRLKLEGAGHYDEQSPIRFRGRVYGHGMAYRIKSLDFKDIDFQSDVLAGPQDWELPHFVLRTLGGVLSGHAAFKQNHSLEIDGTLAGLHVRTFARLLSNREFPWSGVARGPLRLRAAWDRNWRDLSVEGKLGITSDGDGIPLSASLDGTYWANGNRLEFRPSSLRAANTNVAFSGTLNSSLDVGLDSTNLEDVRPVLLMFNAGSKTAVLPVLGQNGTAHFDGKVLGLLASPQISGNVALRNFKVQDQVWDQLRSRLIASANQVEFSSLSIDQSSLHASADGRVGLQNWAVNTNSAFRMKGEYRRVDLAKLAKSVAWLRLESIGGISSGSFDVTGTLLNIRGTAQFDITNVDAYGERLNQLRLGAVFSGDSIQISKGHMQAGPAELEFSGRYQHSVGSWREGQLELKLDSNGFPFASVAPLHNYLPDLNAQFEIHGNGSARVLADRIEPLSADGTAALKTVTIKNIPYGSMSFSAATRAQNLTTSFTGNLRGSQVSGTAQVQLTRGNPATGQLHLDRTQLSTILALIRPEAGKLPFDGFLQGGLTFDGRLQQLSEMNGTISIETLQLTPNAPSSPGTTNIPSDLMFRNVSPVVLRYSGGLATIAKFQMRGKGTDVSVSGTFPLVPQRPMQLQLNGSVDLGLIQLLDSRIRASGESLITASFSGTQQDPTVNGILELKNGSAFLGDFPNGLTAVNGTVRFDRDRATIEKLSAKTGGGGLSIGGFLSFGNGAPVVYRLEANADNVRMRYGGVSITATSQLRLAGTSENSILSGTATISRVIFNPSTDVGNLLASAAVPSASPSNGKDFLTGLQFDIHVESAPNLQLNTQLSRDLEADVDLRLRGTPDRPILLGSIAANQGDIRAFGAKYTINRGEVNFVNAASIEPVLDLDLQTQARGITVDITVAGTPGKLNINYRSDPPLQPRDIIALLTVGRAPNITSNVPDVSAKNDVNSLQPGADTVLGAVMSPSSSRLSKLFGITNIKVDPMVQGITNTPQARLTVEQQISKQISVTYVTNLSQTSEQIFRLEWAFSSQYSVVALRDDNGEFGIDLQYRKQFK